MKKVTFIFKLTTANNRTGGWSESLYFDGTFDQAGAAAANLVPLRAKLISEDGVLARLRITDLAAPGKSSLGIQAQKGTCPKETDIPQMGIKCFLFKGHDYKRQYVLAGIPDFYVQKGAWNREANFRNKITDYLEEIRKNSFQFKVRDKDLPLRTVLSIDAQAQVFCSAAHGYVVGDFVRFYRTRDVNKKAVKGEWRITEVNNGGAGFKIANWTGQVVEKGKVRKVGDTFAVVTGYQIDDVTPRKIGRPFDAYRGRKSKAA